MNSFTIEALPWLLAAPGDFRSRISALKSAPELADAGTLQGLASHHLSELQLHALSRMLDLPQLSGRTVPGLSPLKIAVVGSSNTQMIVPALRGTCLRHGIQLAIHEAEFGQIVQEAIDPESEISKAEVDAVVVLLDQSFLPNTSFGDFEKEQREVAAVTSQIETALNGFNANAGAPVVISTIAKPALRTAGSMEHHVPGTPTRCIEEVNRAIRTLTSESSNYLFDLAGLAETVGLSRWTDPGQWFTARLPFEQSLIPIVTEHLARVLAAIRGKTKKVLALDLDHTLWGGVIGDDGIGGVRIGQGDPVGEAHLALQQLALRYKQQGIILTVVSKNDDEVARQPFHELDEMALAIDDFAVFVANWNDKASNLRAIASTLNVGTESIVFVDDNPAERELVRQQLPGVSVPELPSDPAFYAQVVAAAGYFEAVSFTEEDSQRTEMYRANTARKEAFSDSGNIDDFLSSLEMQMSLEPVEKKSIKRVTQLINKTNQFNLTTMRYSEADVLQMVEDENTFPFQVRLTDRFGDNGTISVIICKTTSPDTWQIDSWLMSCRVLKRQVEDASLNRLAELAADQGVTTLLGTFIPSDRNGMVAEFFPSMGFSEAANGAEQESGKTWSLDLSDYKPKSHFISTL